MAKISKGMKSAYAMNLINDEAIPAAQVASVIAS